MEKKQTYKERFSSFYNSCAWKKLRTQKFFDANGLCEECLKKGIIEAGVEVHHKKPIETCWEKRLDYDNLILLCPSCHAHAHERESELQKFLNLFDNI